MTTLKESEDLYEAVCKFVDDYCNFESSVFRDDFKEKLGNETTKTEVFLAPIKARVFDYASAVNWLVFWRVATRSGEMDSAFDNENAFDVQGSLDIIISVYDLGVQEIQNYFEESEEESDGSDYESEYETDEDDEDESADAAGAANATANASAADVANAAAAG